MWRRMQEKVDAAAYFSLDTAAGRRYGTAMGAMPDYLSLAERI
jgi:hypothetical protein